MKTNNLAIPVLMYHHVNPDGDFVNVKPGVFEKHIRFLRELGYSSIHTEDMLSIMKKRDITVNKPVMITFDDGWLDNWLFAYPILKKYNMKAVIFIITSLIAENRRRKRSDEGTTQGLPSHRECQKTVEKGRSAEVMLSWEEIEEMESSGLVEFQSHTHTHRRLDKKGNGEESLNNELHQELETSKSIISRRLKKKCNVLCWPWGKYDNDYIDIARSVGYELLFTTEKGTNTFDADPMRIKRIVIGNIGLFSFRKKMFIYSREWLSKAYLKYFS